MTLVRPRLVQWRYPQRILMAKIQKKYENPSILGFPYFGPYFPSSMIALNDWTPKMIPDPRAEKFVPNSKTIGWSWHQGKQFHKTPKLPQACERT